MLRYHLKYAIILIFLIFTLHASQEVRKQDIKSSQSDIENLLSLVTPIINIQSLIASYLDEWDLDRSVNFDGDIRAMTFSHDGNHIASASSINIKIWDLATSKCIQNFNTAYVTSLAYSPNGKYLASGSVEANIYIWNLSVGNCTQVLEGHSKVVSSLAYSNNSEYLTSGSGDHSLKIWDLSTSRCIHTLRGHREPLEFEPRFDRCLHLAYSPDNTKIASGHFNELKIWNNIKYIPNLTNLISNTGIKIVSIQNIIAGYVQDQEWVVDKELIGHDKDIHSLIYSPNGKYLASSSLDKTIKIWDINTGNCLITINCDDWGPIAYLKDSNFIISAYHNGNIKIWSIDTGNCIQTFNQDMHLKALLCSPNGKYIASGSIGYARNSTNIKIWRNLAQLLLANSKAGKSLNIQS